VKDAQQYWLRHLAAIEREGLTTKAYADREGLPVSKLYHWRRQMKVCGGGGGAPAGGFIAVQVSPAEPPVCGCRLRLGEQAELVFSGLPDVQWVARLVKAMGRLERPVR
jgi:transposase